MTLTFDPEDLDVNSTFTKVVVTAAGGDFFAVRAFGTLAGGEQLRSVRLQAPISASPSDAGTGFCIFEVVASGSGEDAFADQPLLLPIDPVSEFASDLRSIAEEAYADRFGGRDTPDDDTIAAELQPLVDALADGGCTQFPVVQKILAGAYDKTVLTGRTTTVTSRGRRTSAPAPSARRSATAPSRVARRPCSAPRRPAGSSSRRRRAAASWRAGGSA
ncbi:MAG: hypothetical protein H6734_06135 [Alphaproteobacteria bacterium]|nr:hypothetical protein [Alphaproteobacteria bacterium]